VTEESKLGLLDTNVVIHSFAHDAHSAECSRFMRALRDGHTSATLDPLVIHELTYALPQFIKQMSRPELAAFLLEMIGWEAVRCDNKALLVDTLERWRDRAGLGFVDAYLSALALRRDLPVYTKNVRHFLTQGVDVPDPLPSP